MAQETQTDKLPAALSLPINISVRNADLGVNVSGTAGRLDENGLVATLPVAINPGTVLFTTLDMRVINATARALVRVTAQQSLGEDAGYETFGEFVELNEDGRQKVERLHGKRDEAATPRVPRDFATEQLGLQPMYQRGPAAQPDYQVTVESKPTYFEPAPLRAQAEATASTKFWSSLGVTAYIVAFLVLVAFFPKGREVELFIWNNFAHAIARMWYWANHIGEVKLYDNS